MTWIGPTTLAFEHYEATLRPLRLETQCSRCTTAAGVQFSSPHSPTSAQTPPPTPSKTDNLTKRLAETQSRASSNKGAQDDGVVGGGFATPAASVITPAGGGVPGPRQRQRPSRWIPAVRGRQQHSGLSTSKSKKVTSPHAADDDDVEETDTLLDENELESK